MKKIAIILASTLLSLCANAASADTKPLPPLNQVAYHVSAEQWAKTQTAKVIVQVNAALTSKALGQIHGQILQNLRKIYPRTDWHVTQFKRSQDKTGLEQLTVVAQVRIPANALANLRQKAKAVSKPGANYKIVDIQFVPSLAELEKTRADLRNQIYQDAKQELKRLNQVYPKANYHLYKINFLGVDVTPMPRPRAMVLMKTAATQPSLAVSNKVTVTANIVLAAQMPIITTK